MQQGPSPEKSNRPNQPALFLNAWKSACLETLGTLKSLLHSQAEQKGAELRRTKACILAFEMNDHYQLLFIEEDSEQDSADAQGDPFAELMILQDEWLRLQDASMKDQKNDDLN